MESAAASEHRGVAHLAGRGPAVVVFVALMLAAAAYSRALDGEFQLDDGRVIERDTAIRDLRGMAGEALRSGLITGERPLTRLTFALDYAVGDLQPRPYHVTNLLLHLAAVLAVFLLGLRVAKLAGVSGERWIAAAAAAAFSLHPIQSGAVAYISQRSEVLASLLYVVTLLLLLEGERRGRTAAGVTAWVGAFGAFWLALAAKPMAVTAPIAWLLLRFVLPAWRSPPDRRALGRIAALLAPVVALAAWYGAVTVRGLAAGGGHDGGFEVPGLPPAVYLLTQLRVLVIYLRLLLFPVGQNVDWDVVPSGSLLEPATALSGLFLVALVATAARSWWLVRRREDPAAGATRLAVFGLLWFFVLVGPTSSLIPLADLLVEHRLYLASWGILLAVAALAGRALGALEADRARRIAVAAGAVVAVAFGTALVQRTTAWASRYALWSDSVTKSPAKARPWAELALALQERGRIDEATLAYRQALARLRAFDREAELQIRRNFSALLAATGRADEAVTVLQRATELAPGNAEIATNMGLALLQRGDLGGAWSWIERALALDPRLPEAHGLRGSLLLRRGDPGGAAGAFENALRMAPGNAAFAFNLGVALDRLGRLSEACSAWRRAEGLRRDPVLAERVGRAVAARCSAAP